MDTVRSGNPGWFAASDRFITLLIALLVTEGVLGAVFRGERWLRVLRGNEPTAMDALQMAGVVLIPATAWAILRLAQARRGLEDRLGESEEWLESALETSQEWIWSIDLEGRITSTNLAGARILGREPAELVGVDCARLLHPEDAATVAQLLPRFLEKRAGWSGLVLRWRHADGSYRYLESNAVPILGGDGELQGWRGSDRDLTDRHAADRTAREKRERIQGVLADGSLTMVFQPIVSFHTGGVVGVEALARFPDRAVTPDVWFAEAAEASLGAELELLAIRKALAELPRLPGDAYLSLNLSPGTMSDPRLSDLLAEVPAAEHRIVLEITEHAIIEDYDAMAQAIDLLRGRGIRIAVDDAGAGFASLRHILRLRPDIIKLDRGIVSGVHTDRGHRALAGALARFADEIGAEVVAEGVETREELRALSDVGIQFGQGYLFLRPGPAPLPPVMGLDGPGAADAGAAPDEMSTP